MTKRIITLLAMILSASCVFAANLEVLTFDESSVGQPTILNEWSHGAFSVISEKSFIVRPDGSTAWAPSNGTAFAQLAMGQNGAVITNTASELFSLVRLDIAEYGQQGNGSIRMVKDNAGTPVPQVHPRALLLGVRSDGAVVSHDYQLDAVCDGAGAQADFERVMLPTSFTGLVSVVLALDGLAVDNIAVCTNPSIPVVTVTNADAVFAYETATASVAGINNANVVGTMTWSNSLTGASGTFAAAGGWSVPSIALNPGANVITVRGSNDIGWVTSDSVTITREDVNGRTWRRPTLSWTETAGATYYYLHISRNSKTYLQQWLSQTGTTWTVDRDLPGGDYAWWVRPWTPGIGKGAWSTGMYFSVATRVPGAVALAEPSGAISTNTPQFSWAVDTNATYYYVWLTRNGSAYLKKWVNASTTYTHSASLPYGDYSWWVRTWGPDGYGLWSSPLSFSYGVPTTLSPTGTVNGTRQPAFYWAETTDAAWYQLFINRNGSLYHSEWTNGMASTNWVPNTDMPAGSYQWWIQSWNPDTSAWSPAANFTIPAQIPAQITLVSPTGLSAGTSQNYTWDADAAATHYQLYVSEDGAAWHMEWYNTGIVTGQVAKAVGSHVPGSVYSWWVRGWSPDGMGTWSAMEQFTAQ